MSYCEQLKFCSYSNSENLGSPKMAQMVALVPWCLFWFLPLSLLNTHGLSPCMAELTGVFYPSNCPVWLWIGRVPHLPSHVHGWVDLLAFQFIPVHIPMCVRNESDHKDGFRLTFSKRCSEKSFTYWLRSHPRNWMCHPWHPGYDVIHRPAEIPYFFFFKPIYCSVFVIYPLPVKQTVTALFLL